MSRFDEVLASPEWAFAFAAALEQQLGDDRILTVGSPHGTAREVMAGDVVAGDDAGEQHAQADPDRTVTARFTTADGYRGMIALLARSGLAAALEQVASDGVLATACATAFDVAVTTIGKQAIVGIERGPASETIRDSEGDVTGDVTTDGGPEAGADDIAAFPVLDGGAVLGALELRVSRTPDDTAALSAPTGTDAAQRASRDVTTTSPSYVLADVEMGVTAELGRCRMTMRELLSITPGAVIDLDRAAGAPVDVLVNGTLIARGEVVVVDEEFGIRISELVAQPAATR